MNFSPTRGSPISSLAGEWQILIERIRAADAYWAGVNSRNSEWRCMYLHNWREVWWICFWPSSLVGWSTERRRWYLSRNTNGPAKLKSKSRALTIFSSKSIKCCLLNVFFCGAGNREIMISKHGTIGSSILAAMRREIVANKSKLGACWLFWARTERYLSAMFPARCIVSCL